MIGTKGTSGTALIVCIVATLAISPASCAYATPGATQASSYLLTNGRIVISHDETLEIGSVLIRDGRIEAVGAQLAAPPEAHVLDIAGLTVYPGFVDAASTALLSTAEVAGIDPTRRILDQGDISESAKVSWRAVGVTATGLAYIGGTDARREPGPQFRVVQEDHPLLPGQTSLVHLGLGSLHDLVVLPSAAMQVGFGTRTIHEYPVTLMGAIAYVHQVFLDAGYQGPKSEPRDDAVNITFRREVTGLEAAARGEQQVWFTVWQENNLKRAVDLAEKLGLDYALLGAQEGFRAVERIARTGRPVLVSLAYPDPERATGRSYALDVFGFGTGEVGNPLQVDSAAKRTYRGNAAALVAAGIPVALTSYGLEDAGHFRTAILEAVEAGLAPRDALRALTITPARILGVDDRLGTVEEGKDANLLVVEGDLFGPGGVIRQVFVQGQLVDIEPSAEASGADGSTGTVSVGTK